MQIAEIELIGTTWGIYTLDVSRRRDRRLEAYRRGNTTDRAVCTSIAEFAQSPEFPEQDPDC